MELGKSIIEIRKKNDMTQEEMAERYHVTRQTISNWENGKSYPDLETLVNISEDFHVSLDALLKGDRKMVSEITKEQKHGKRIKWKIVLGVLAGVALVMASLYLLNNKTTSLNPGEYELKVNKVMLENVSVDEKNRVAVYKDADDEKYMFEGDEYDLPMKSGCIYEIIVTSDKCIDGIYIDSLDDGSLSIDVWQSGAGLLGKEKIKRHTSAWLEEFDAIYDWNAYNDGEKEKACVYKNSDR